MDLDQWLVVYLSLVTAASSKRTNLWSMLGLGLVAQVLLGVAVCILVVGLPSPMGDVARFVLISLSGLGLAIAFGWGLILRTLSARARVAESLARGIEAHFAGSEFHRALHRYELNEKVCVPSSEWTCNEWLPSVASKPRLLRVLGGLGIPLLVLPLLAGWISLLFYLLR